MADNISSFGLVAISSSSGVIWIVFAGGTAFKIVTLVFCLSLLLLLPSELLFRIIQLDLCFLTSSAGVRIAA